MCSMQFFSLFASRLKSLKKQKKDNIIVEQKFILMFLKCETLIHFYIKLRC